MAHYHLQDRGIIEVFESAIGQIVVEVRLEGRIIKLGLTSKEAKQIANDLQEASK